MRSKELVRSKGHCHMSCPSPLRMTEGSVLHVHAQQQFAECRTGTPEGLHSMKCIRNASFVGFLDSGVVMMAVECSVGLQPACMTSQGKAAPFHIHEQDRPMPPTQVPFWSCLCMQGSCPPFFSLPFGKDSSGHSESPSNQMRTVGH